MGAQHTLDNTGLQHMRLPGIPSDPGPHCLELYELGSEAFLAVTLDASAPEVGKRRAVLTLSPSDLRKLLDGVNDLLTRTGPDLIP